jgi:hypothetical protein
MEVEQWVRECSAQAVADYFKAGGVERVRDGEDRHLADYEVDAEITCILREDHPDCRDDDDNIVAELRWLGSLRREEPIDDIYTYNWNPYQYQAGHPLEHDHYCWLFHDLTDHALHCDWDKVLAIGGVWIDVTLTPQRGIYW